MTLDAARPAGCDPSAAGRARTCAPASRRRSTTSSPARPPACDAVSDDLAPLVRRRRATCSRGGKRLRPAFCYWGWRGAGGAGRRAGSVTRGGRARAAPGLRADPRRRDGRLRHPARPAGRAPAVRRAAPRRRLARRRRRRSATGAAILLGDLCLSWADEMLFGSGPAGRRRCCAARPVFDQMRTELMAGQYLDLLEQARGGGSVERALRVIRYKSAQVHRRAAAAPRRRAGRRATATLLAAYTAYGLPLGEAFQLRDDVLGVFGDPAETGKPAGDDLREGKRTVLVALAARAGDARRRPRSCGRHLGDPHAGRRRRRRAARGASVDTGALAEVEELIADAAPSRRWPRWTRWPASPSPARAVLARAAPSPPPRAAADRSRRHAHGHRADRPRRRRRRRARRAVRGAAPGRRRTRR